MRTLLHIVLLVVSAQALSAELRREASWVIIPEPLNGESFTLSRYVDRDRATHHFVSFERAGNLRQEEAVTPQRWKNWLARSKRIFQTPARPGQCLDAASWGEVSRLFKPVSYCLDSRQRAALVGPQGVVSEITAHLYPGRTP